MFKQSDLICILGPRGSGKSVMTREISAAMPKLFVFDTAHEYQVTDCDLFADTPAKLGAIAKVILEHKPKKYRVIYQWNVSSSAELEEDLDPCLEILYHLGNCHTVIEELPQYTGPRGMPPWLRKLILMGRHRNVGITATSQRPAEIPKTFISGCRHVFTARFDEANDLKYFSETLGKTTINYLRNLKNHEFLHYERPGKLRVSKVSNPRF